jgi:glyoxylase-like metal-dependent hydrolase (beta-lactamase superfamily II)
MRPNDVTRVLALSTTLLATACSSRSTQGAAAVTDSGAPPMSLDSGGSGATPGDASPGPAITVQTYTASGAPPGGVAVNSHLLMGPTQAILVDGQLYKADAEKVVQMIQASGRTLTTVFLTHAHPDHYAELDVYKAAFPSAAFVTTAGVLGDFNTSAPGTFQYLKSELGDLVADTLVTPTALAGSTLTIDAETIDVLEMPSPGESEHAGALALTAEGALVSGDLLYDDVNLFLGECHAQGWLANLAAFQSMPLSTFYPGHGAKIGSAVFATDAAYIMAASQILAAEAAMDAGVIGDAGDPRVAAAIGQIQAKYPTYESSYLLGYSVSQYFANCVH